MKGKLFALIPAFLLIFALTGCDPAKTPTVTPTPTPAAGAFMTPAPTYNAGANGRVEGDSLLKDAERGVHNASQDIANATR